ncbi:hypothetical protein Pyn_33733 [Prunus yedoensis var. nudiflora]|uniref:Uncharacterized protein n=1 Tax=Prunus yedoensis var. nudiflora TaxID=2094558 RepID=A0A314XPT2_PRUYE|nr:hypothetical protein Pyn_33733 [Prunus yedoensis var. nudiflora]
MSQCSFLPVGNILTPTLPFTYWEPKRAFTFYKLGGIAQPTLLMAASFSTTMRTHLSSATASIPAAITIILEPSISILWLLQASQQPSTNISWSLKHPSNHQTTFLPLFSHSLSHHNHVSYLLSLKSIIFSIKPFKL